MEKRKFVKTFESYSSSKDENLNESLLGVVGGIGIALSKGILFIASLVGGPAVLAGLIVAGTVATTITVAKVTNYLRGKYTLTEEEAIAVKEGTEKAIKNTKDEKKKNALQAVLDMIMAPASGEKAGHRIDERKRYK